MTEPLDTFRCASIGDQGSKAFITGFDLVEDPHLAMSRNFAADAKLIMTTSRSSSAALGSFSVLRSVTQISRWPLPTRHHS